MNERMERALILADKCWDKTSKSHPEFVEEYLRLSEQLLLSLPTVTGDTFREYCKDNGLYRPQGLHPNVWVSGVRTLNILGWITPVTKVEPVRKHNHMPTVTLWRSEVFSGFVCHNHGFDDLFAETA